MDVIIHRIHVRDDVAPARFAGWVREVDYAGCAALPSVQSFAVARVAGTERDFVEIITVTSRAEFARDMTTSAFARLEHGFDELAVVLDELSAERVEPGYVVPQPVIATS